MFRERADNAQDCKSLRIQFDSGTELHFGEECVKIVNFGRQNIQIGACVLVQILCPNCHSQTDTYAGKNRTLRSSTGLECLITNQGVEGSSPSEVAINAGMM